MVAETERVQHGHCVRCPIRVLRMNDAPELGLWQAGCVRARAAIALSQHDADAVHLDQQVLQDLPFHQRLCMETLLVTDDLHRNDGACRVVLAPQDLHHLTYRRPGTYPQHSSRARRAGDGTCAGLTSLGSMISTCPKLPRPRVPSTS